MNGGAWLSLDGVRVDVLLRDLDAVERFSAAARRGEYEVDALLGYLAGVPTHSLLAELALGRVLTGKLPAAGVFPEALRVTASRRWRFNAEFSLEYARKHAARDELIGAVGQAAKAAVEAGHAILCARREWVLNEKRLVERAGLSALRQHFAQVPAERAGLVLWLDSLESHLSKALPDCGT